METIIYGDSLAGSYGIGSLQLMGKSKGVQRVIYKNGYTVTDLIECLNREVLDYFPNQVVVICGTNDALQMRRAEDILESVIFMCRQIKVNARPIWLIPPQIDCQLAAIAFGDSIAFYQQVNLKLSKLRDLAAGLKEGILLVDLETFCKQYSKQQKGAVYVDGIHFHSAFHDALAKYLDKKLFEPRLN